MSYQVKCTTLAPKASLELLLRAGGVAHLLDEPPRAAILACELCEGLPLALGIAAGMSVHGLRTSCIVPWEFSCYSLMIAQVLSVGVWQDS